MLIADDHAVVRRGLKEILGVEPDITLVAEAESGAQVVDFVRDLPCDVLILDLNLPDRSGLDVLKEIKTLRPKLSVLILTMHSAEQFAVRVLKAGASGYMTKDAAPEELVRAIRTIVRGVPYVTAVVAERLVESLSSDPDKPTHERLSDREYEVLRLIGRGWSPTQIATELGLSVKTVSTYRSRILDKLALHTTAELIHYAVQHRLVE